MSRIGKYPVTVPSGVEVNIDGQHLHVKGPKGELEHTVGSPITVNRNDDGALAVERPDDERDSKAMHGLSRTLVDNMVVGVSQGFERHLEIVGVGYRVLAKGPKAIELYLGYSHVVPFEAPEGITLQVESPTKLSVQGIDKQLVGETAANIRKLRRPEPYKGKGVRYANERVRRKAGKAGK